MFPAVPSSEQASQKENEAHVIKRPELKGCAKGRDESYPDTLPRGILGRAGTARHWTKKPPDTPHVEYTSRLIHLQAAELFTFSPHLIPTRCLEIKHVAKSTNNTTRRCLWHKQRGQAKLTLLIPSSPLQLHLQGSPSAFPPPSPPTTAALVLAASVPSHPGRD